MASTSSPTRTDTSTDVPSSSMLTTSVLLSAPTGLDDTTGDDTDGDPPLPLPSLRRSWGDTVALLLPTPPCNGVTGELGCDLGCTCRCHSWRCRSSKGGTAPDAVGNSDGGACNSGALASASKSTGGPARMLASLDNSSANSSQVIDVLADVSCGEDRADSDHACFEALFVVWGHNRQWFTATPTKLHAHTR